MDRKLMKWYLGPIALILLSFVSCEKMTPYHEDGSEITSAEAVEIVRPILDKYAQDGRGYCVGKNPIPANTTMKYGPLVYYDPSMEGCGTFKSPRFKAWLIVIGMDTSINGSKYMQPHLFVDVVTGTFKEVDVEGQVSGIEWDDSFGITVDDPTPFL